MHFGENGNKKFAIFSCSKKLYFHLKPTHVINFKDYYEQNKMFMSSQPQWKLYNYRQWVWQNASPSEGIYGHPIKGNIDNQNVEVWYIPILRGSRMH